MTGGYQVDLGEMNKLVTTLGQAKDRMTAATRSLAESAAKDLGSADIDKAGSDFQDRWEYGIGKVADFTGSVVEALTKTKNIYAEMEDKVTEMLGKGQQPAASPSQSEIGRRLDGGEA